MLCKKSDEPIVVNNFLPMKGGDAPEDKTGRMTCKVMTAVMKVTTDDLESKVTNHVRRGEVEKKMRNKIRG